MQDKTKGNPTNFKVGSNLSSLFEKAKEHNHLNSLLKAQFSDQFKGLSPLLFRRLKALPYLLKTHP